MQNDLTIEIIAKRIFDQKEDFMRKFTKKNESEEKYYEIKQHISETFTSSRKKENKWLKKESITSFKF